MMNKQTDLAQANIRGATKPGQKAETISSNKESKESEAMLIIAFCNWAPSSGALTRLGTIRKTAATTPPMSVRGWPQQRFLLGK